ncbi:hypothetical protein N9H39_07015 [Gammaproteobacteria bacterium]|nr:hypothetical protein [Gammaproteobacteria bacterium]
MNPTYKFSHITFRTQTALLLYICLIPGGPWNGVFAQSEPGIERTDSAVVRPAASHPVPGSGEDDQSDNGSHEMPVFFMIGIAINAIMMLSFAVWFVSEWKKQNKRKAGGKRK